MDIYAKVKYNRPDELVRSMSCAFASWDAAQLNNKIGSKAGVRQGCLALCFASAVSLIKLRLSDKKRV